MRLQVGARTDTGRVRDLNEDVYLLDEARGLFVVCDGMGGCPAGEVASEMAVRTIHEHMNAFGDAAAASGGDYLPQTTQLRRAVEQSNAYIYEQSRADPRHAGMGTTVVSARIVGPLVSLAHVGDSRAYLWHRERLERLTRDHSLRETDRRRNMLLRALGREPRVEVELREVAVQPGDYVLLCSDGLTGMVSEPAVSRAIAQLRDPQRICDYLIDAANTNGGADNITVIVIRIIDTWWRRFLSHWTRRLSGGHIAAAHSAS